MSFPKFFSSIFFGCHILVHQKENKNTDLFKTQIGKVFKFLTRNCLLKNPFSRFADLTCWESWSKLKGPILLAKWASTLMTMFVHEFKFSHRLSINKYWEDKEADLYVTIYYWGNSWIVYSRTNCPIIKRKGHGTHLGLLLTTLLKENIIIHQTL